MTEIKFHFQPKQRQFLETIETTPITFYGGAKGGGKSRGLRDIMLLRRLQYPNSTGAIFRRTFPELEGNHIRPLLQSYPQIRSYWNDSKKLLSLPNGSTLQFCHCQNEKDVDLYKGREFHDLAIDEAGQWPEAMFRRLLGSNRSSSKGVLSRAILTGNPGGIGHGWLKRIFIERRFNARESERDYAFIQALVTDNQALMENDPAYVARLESEPNEALRKAYRYGDWEIFAGQFFQEITREVHFIEPFEIPRHWSRFGAYDFGYNHPAEFGWFANDEDGNTILYREHIQANCRVDQFSRKLNSFSDTANLYPIVGGADCWTQRAVLRDSPNPPTIAEEFLSHGIQLKRAVIDRIQGAAQVRSYLAWRGKGRNELGAPCDGKPRFYIFNTCPISFDTLTRMVHDPDRIEDVLKQDATEGDPNSGDDAYDMIRYGLMSRPSITDKIVPRMVIGTKAWHDDQNARAWEIEREKLEDEYRKIEEY